MPKNKVVLEAVIQTTRDAILVLDKEGRIQLISPSVEPMFEWAGEDIKGRPLESLLAEGAGLAYRRLWMRCKTDLAPATEEVEAVRRSGAAFPVELSLFSSTGPDGPFVVAVIRNLTERCQALDQVSRTEQECSAVLDNLGVGVAVIGRDMRVLSLNTLMRQWNPQVDVSAGPLCYQAFNRPPRDAVCDYCPTCKTLEDGQVHEAITQTPSGDRVVNYRVVSSPIVSLDGRVVAAVEMVEDVTVRHRQEQTLQATHTEIQEVIEILSNDFTAPLRGTCTVVDWLASEYQDRLDDQGREYVGILKDESLRMRAMILGVLHYMKATYSGTTLAPATEVDLRVLAEQAVDRLVPSPSVKVVTEASLPVVWGHEGHLREILEALIKNALTCTDRPGGLVTIGAHEEDDRWEVYVSDNGPGIDPALQERIFDLSRTLAACDGCDPAGGVSLAVVKKLAADSGGRVWVESIPGRGSTFKFAIPKTL